MPVLAVLVCHDGEEWLRLALSALRRSTPRPRHVVAVDTGSADGTAKLLAASEDVVDGVIELDRSSSFGDAVAAALRYGVERWGDPGGWLWLLHDDCAPEPHCLGTLLTAAELSPSAGVLGPVAHDWDEPRLIVGAGLSTDASGHRQTGIGTGEWVRARQVEQSSEVLAVPSAGLLVRRELWERLGGFDSEVPGAFDDIDFGWRANRSGAVALCVPAARIKHANAGRVDNIRARSNGVRTFLVNSGFFSFLIGVPRLAVLCLLRALGFLLLRRISRAHGEIAAAGRLLGGRMRLLRARRARRGLGQTGSVRGLFTSRSTRLRNTFRAAVTYLVRRRVEADVALGEAPETVWIPPEETQKPIGPDALPAGALGRAGQRKAAGLRRPPSAVTVSVPAAKGPKGRRPSPRPRPSPVPRDGSPQPEVLLVEVDRGRVLKQILLAPPLLLVLGLVAGGLVINWNRLSLSLTGGRLLPVSDVWTEYLSAWHAVSGGTASPAPTALAVLGILGGQAGLLLIGDLPLAGLSAYIATRKMGVRRGIRAVIAGLYALLPPAIAAVSQGRLDAVVVHILLPVVVSGIVSVLTGASRSWLSVAAGSSLGLAVIGAFSPLVHLVILVCALAGFVLVAGQRGDGKRRGAALFAIVLLPLALLLPWPAVLIQNPAIVVHGVGGWVPYTNDFGSVVLALVVAVVAAAGLVAQPGRGSLPGLGLLALGIGAAAVVRFMPMAPVIGGAPQQGWLGTPLIVVGWGLLWALTGTTLKVRPAMAIGATALVVLAGGAFLLGRGGSLTTQDSVRLGTAPARELAETGRGVLVLSRGDQPARQAAGRMPQFGDDDLVPVASARARILRWDNDFRSDVPDLAKAAVSSAAAAGVLFVVMPDQTSGQRLQGAAGDLVAATTSTSDGRPVFRLQPAAGRAVLLAPELAKQAVTGGVPPTALGAGGIVPVDAGPPEVAVRVSDGSDGRLLVIAAAEEPGWRAEVNGRQVPVVRAWGNLVGVAVPARASDVRVEYSSDLRAFLLLIQGAALLFTLLTAIPGRRTQAPPSMASGSTLR
ncbi:glycosyltransferase [Kibdelosporangium philippinense]|uniref:Glycosyltransferase n=1 Tax=Kibdelosporangium philippinense TaxID=211113 RepID=A0ABS8ZEU6_9PSEU|nr:glycosyltransferase family 2 protein [Kibdelosporangium philippinense]MCE7006062.1 glycosyltransferase [Kibdelosporangium philippinense]